jgi:hemoglobin-like flavoprotein
MTRDKPIVRHTPGSVSARDLELVRASLSRCGGLGAILPIFYQRLFDSSMTVKRKFEKTDMRAQVELLKHGLTAAILHAEGNAMARSVVQRLKQSHSQAHLDVEPHLYEYWLNALLAAVREVDPGWAATVEHAWRRVLRPCIAEMAMAY